MVLIHYFSTFLCTDATNIDTEWALFWPSQWPGESLNRSHREPNNWGSVTGVQPRNLSNFDLDIYKAAQY